MSSDIEQFGWTAVVRDASKLLGGEVYINKPTPLTVDDIPFPSDDEIVARVQQYAQKELLQQTYHHSMRVYYFSRAIQTTQFPDSKLSPRTLALTALLHDISTTQKNIHSTHLSFEYQGGMVALDLLLSPEFKSTGTDVSKSEAESVAETIFRHQDIGNEGKVSFLTAIIQLATIYDNMGGHEKLVDKATLESVVKAFPRLGWSGCFANTIKEELGLKPWSHTSVVPGFEEGVRGNKLMQPYD